MLTKPRNAFRGQSRSPNIVLPGIPYIRYSFLLCNSNVVFFRYSTSKNENPGQRSFKVTENYTIRSDTRDFLLTFHSNHRPISYHFRYKRRFSLKIASFPTPVYLKPRWRGSLWNWVSAQWSEETRMIGLPDGGKSFKIGLAGISACYIHRATQPATLP